jgi:hypothetical protein
MKTGPRRIGWECVVEDASVYYKLDSGLRAMETAFTAHLTGPAFVLVWTATLVTIVGGFTLLARLAYQPGHGSRLAMLWGVASLLYGYGSFRVFCSQPITCDVGPDPFSLHYLVTVGPPYAVIGAVTFGVASMLVIRTRRWSRSRWIDRGVLLSVGGALLSWAIARLVVYDLWLAAV